MRKLILFLVIGLGFFALTGQSYASGFAGNYVAPNTYNITDRSSCSVAFYPQLLDTNGTTVLHQWGFYGGETSMTLDLSGYGLVNGSTYYINDNCGDTLIKNTLSFTKSSGATPTPTPITANSAGMTALSGLLTSIRSGLLSMIPTAVTLAGPIVVTIAVIAFLWLLLLV